MSTEEEYRGYYCLLIAILCDLDAADAQVLYEHGPDHPCCRKLLKRKAQILEMENTGQKGTAGWIQMLREDSCTFEEIAAAIGCCPSTVRRRLKKAGEKKRQEE